jgi:hypothetical protein
MIMKRLALIVASVITAVVSAADVEWKFSPEAVNLDKGVTCTKSENGWTLTPSRKGVFKFFSKDVFEIKPDSKYYVRIQVRGLKPNSRIWVVSQNFTEDGREINPTSVDFDEKTILNIGSYVHHGTTQIKIPGAEKWPEVKRATVLMFNVKADNSDSPNHDYYPIKSIDKDGVITLTRPLRRGYRAETLVRRHFLNGSNHTLIGSTLTPEFQTNRRELQGLSEKGCIFTKWLRGTAKVRIGLEVSGGDIELKELSFVEMTN